TRERRTELSRHTRGGHDCSAAGVFVADNQFGRHDAVRFVQLPLQHNAALHAGPIRICALPFAKSQLVGHVCWKVTERWKHYRYLGLYLPRARAAEAVIKS